MPVGVRRGRGVKGTGGCGGSGGGAGSGVRRTRRAADPACMETQRRARGQQFAPGRLYASVLQHRRAQQLLWDAETLHQRERLRAQLLAELVDGRNDRLGASG